MNTKCRQLQPPSLRECLTYSAICIYLLCVNDAAFKATIAARGIHNSNFSVLDPSCVHAAVTCSLYFFPRFQELLQLEAFKTFRDRRDM